MSSQTAQQLVLSDFALDVRDGLTKTGQRELPSKYLREKSSRKCHCPPTWRSWEAAAARKRASSSRRWPAAGKHFITRSKFRQRHLPRAKRSSANWIA